ncbi:MAG: cell shape determination protein CcmA [Gammaproteobacteria bacterium]|nr:MAG: cell shape determination protein CcmA [Gammaproteobacteria bacterium]RKZ95174.1 MAG: cell shape determination protein CcmA [Gammaproteobacteria bacterium]RKZ98464.1 MAG: cell shape determination protein CcmA [Gammaproteobacteria bacterium]RKZ99747.1 MAG: cell shape determination protein CcmA [Gammaproteobacteria bacterium]HHA19223.1 polymer-forming cytoskeletal protein [Methylophaga sp.]
MFNKEKNKPKSTRIDTLIGQNTQIKGDISFSGGLRIDGTVTGNITAKGDDKSVLTISEQGKIEGEVRVPNLLINGSISGNVYASEHVELAPKAKVEGNLYYHLLEMAMGSEVNGQLIRMTEKNDNILNVEHEVIDDETFQLEQKD